MIFLFLSLLLLCDFTAMYLHSLFLCPLKSSFPSIFSGFILPPRQTTFIYNKWCSMTVRLHAPSYIAIELVVHLRSIHARMQCVLKYTIYEYNSFFRKVHKRIVGKLSWESKCFFITHKYYVPRRYENVYSAHTGLCFSSRILVLVLVFCLEASNQYSWKKSISDLLRHNFLSSHCHTICDRIKMENP